MGLVKFLRFLRLKVVRRRRVAAVHDMINADEDNKGMIILCWEDVERLTKNLSTVIGHGGFSKVYLARFPDSSTAAVKIQCCTTHRLHEAYNQELQILLHLNHPNIVKLLGHCHQPHREEGILILEHAPNGNLHEKLHNSTHSSNKSKGSLSWKRRMTIAFQLAQALDYLHKCNIIHGDIKASNILLDAHLNTKLCDFGSSNTQLSSSVHTNNRKPRIMHGSPGYTDPNYLKTGVASHKNDVYSFGVIVLELITGMQALNPLTGERLTSRVDPILIRDGEWREKVIRIVDPRVMRGFEMEEALAMAELSAICLCDDSTDRPSFSHIVASIRNNVSCV